MSLQFYASKALAYFPLLPGRKEPAVSEGFKSSKEECALAFEKYPHANIGLICGKESGNLIIVDFESEFDAWILLDRETTLANTLCAKTAHNGIHAYFRTLNTCPRRQTKLEGVEHPFDLCGSGGYVCAPPSIIEHKFCPKSKENCPHEGKSQYYFLNPGVEIQLVSGLEESIKERVKALGWIQNTPRVELKTNSELLDKALSRDRKFADILRGNWQDHKIKSRSEAEYICVLKLVRLGFSDEDIRTALDSSQIGKWQEKEESYRTVTLDKARRFVIASHLRDRISKKPEILEDGKIRMSYQCEACQFKTTELKEAQEHQETPAEQGAEHWFETNRVVLP